MHHKFVILLSLTTLFSLIGKSYGRNDELTNKLKFGLNKTNDSNQTHVSNRLNEWSSEPLNIFFNDEFNKIEEQDVDSINEIDNENLESYEELDTLVDSGDNDDRLPRTIEKNLCKIDNCKDANQTNPDYYLVDCLSKDLNYICYYCPKDRVLIKHTHRCAGPCEKEACQKLINFYEPIDCPLDYLKDKDDSSLCIKEDSFKDVRPLSISYFYPKYWKTILGSSNSTLIHHINLIGFKDENQENICKFELKIKEFNDQINYFTLENNLNSIDLYLNGTSSNFDSALIYIDCTYKEKFILHRTELHFNMDSI